MKTILELIDVAKRYDSPSGEDSPAVLRGISLAVEEGASLAITGPSGCGKSTLLNIMAALDRPSSGQVLLDGADLAAMSDDELSTIRNRQIGFVFQLHHLLPQLTALENVLAPAMARSAADSAVIERATGLLGRVGLGGRMDYLPGQLSGGERQRTAVARAMINSPRLMLCDEPTGSLDRRAADEIAALLAELNASGGLTLIVVTHSMDLAHRCHQIKELRDGTLHDI